MSPVEQTGPLATLDELKKTSPFKYRTKTSSGKDVVEILSDPEPEPRRVNDQMPVYLSRPAAAHQRKTSRSKPVDPTLVAGSDPATVLTKLVSFRDNLAMELSRSAAKAAAGSTIRRTLPTGDDLPFVSRWVDYSRKHGVGYVLSDGTVGCIINASSKPGQVATPVTHVLVRNGQRWLQKLGNDKSTSGKDSFAGVDSVPLEIFEDRSALPSSDLSTQGIFRKIYKGLGSVQSGPHAVDSERRRTLSVLWVKFGRYMCQSLDGSGEAGPRSAAGGAADDVFVRFYQRISTVGLWAFSDGCLQVHFPDHTKIVLSADGTTISATLLSVDAASHLAAHGELLAQHVNSREVHAGSVRTLLFESARPVARVVRANQLAEKLAFVLKIAGQWAGNGGLGRLDEDDQAYNGVKLSWDGLTVKDSARKAVERVTVGRHGGD